MRSLRYTLAVLLLTTSISVAVAQEAERIPRVTGVFEYLGELDYPDGLSLRLTGVFRSTDFETYAQMTLDPFADLSVIGQWSLVRGERYDYELSLASDDEWALRSLALSVLGQAAAKSATASPTAEMSLAGSFIARHGGMMLPQYTADGEAEREAIVRLATLVLPDPSGFNAVETDDERLKIARLDVLDFVSDCERLGGQAVLQVDAPQGSLVRLWTIGYPDEAVTLPVSEPVGTRVLPPAPWSLWITLPEGMTVADLPDGRVNLQLDADGVLPDWLEPRANQAP